MKVFVYYNLHKNCFSVKALQGPNKGKVVAHLDQLVLEYVWFKVSETGRQRVLREKRKNVHAGVEGYWYQDRQHETAGLSREVMYDPYKYSTFVTVDSQAAIHTAPRALLVNKKVFIP